MITNSLIVVTEITIICSAYQLPYQPPNGSLVTSSSNSFKDPCDSIRPSWLIQDIFKSTDQQS